MSKAMAGPGRDTQEVLFNETLGNSSVAFLYIGTATIAQHAGVIIEQVLKWFYLIT